MSFNFPSVEIARPFGAPLGLNIQRLVASCAAFQAATPTAAAEARLAGERFAPVRPVDALVILLGGGSGWTASVAILGGSFNPGAARYASDKML